MVVQKEKMHNYQSRLIQMFRKKILFQNTHTHKVPPKYPTTNFFMDTMWLFPGTNFT